LLNELEVLCRSLSRRGIQTQAWHPWVQIFKKGGALATELDTVGNLARVSLLSPEVVTALRNIAPDFHNSFPGFNLNCPLLELEDTTMWNQPEALWHCALTITPQSPLAYEVKDFRRLERLLGDFPLKEIAPRLAGGGPKLEATLAILDRLATARFQAEGFLRALVLHVVAAAQDGRVPRDIALEVLYGKPNKKKLKLEDFKITLIFEVADMDRFPYRVADPAVASEVSDFLLRSDPEVNHSAFRCALSGQLDSPIGDKMPNPNLPILGPTYLMSMNKDIGCQTRYGRTSTDIFAVGKNTVQGLNDAIRFMTDAARRDRTWTGVPNGFKDQGDLLITYLEEEPESDLSIVELFADPTSASEMATYEARTAEIHAALERRKGSTPDPLIRVIALSQIDKGRKQIVFSGCYAASAIYEGRDRWLAGAQNIPTIRLPFPIGKGKRAELRSTFAPSPAQVMFSFKRQWLRAGQSNQAVPGVDLGRIYGLMLEPDATKQAGWLLDRYLGLTDPLLAGIARMLRGGATLPEFARNEALIILAVYGILLFRQDRTKEKYMQSRDYLLGQFLQLSDTLHKFYCKYQRNDSIPPQLIGNAAIPMAMQSPKRALEVLCLRMRIYLAWADQYKGDNAGLVIWCRRELGRISALLKDHDLIGRVNSTGKAELLLGYLANTKESEKMENSL
jgi:hypothetical protein